jgi:hypothetical protein
MCVCLPRLKLIEILILRTSLIWKAGMDDWEKAETVLFPARTNPAINNEINKTKVEEKKKEVPQLRK